MEKEIDVKVELNQEKALNGILRDSVNQQGQTIRHMKNIIISLVAGFIFTVCFGFGSFCWYESKFDTEDAKQETTVYTEGDNANAEYIDGNQYNDSSVHN